MSLVILQVIVHATILHCSLFIVHWPHFIVHSFHNIVQPDVQHVVHNANCAIVHNLEQFAPTLQVSTDSKMALLLSVNSLCSFFLLSTDTHPRSPRGTK